MNKPKLGDLLVEANLIDEVQMRIALEEQKRRGTKFGSTLIALHFIDENVLTAFLSKQLDIPCISLANIEIHDKVLKRITSDLAHHWHAVPIRADAGKLYMAMADPMDMEAIEALENHTKMVVVPMVAPQSSLNEALERHFPDGKKKIEVHAEAVASIFPELIREINEMDLFGGYFGQINTRLDRIEERLTELSRLLESRPE
jgi:type IV pilus assembly protein PilB